MGSPTKAEDPLAHLRQLANALGAVLWLRDLREERLLYLRPAFEKIWGRPVADLLVNPKLWVDSIHPDDRERVLSGAIDAREGAHAQEYRIVRPDGAVRFIKDRAYPILDAKGKLVRLAGVAEDVTPA